MKFVVSIDNGIMYEEVVNSLGNIEGIRERVINLLLKLADKKAISIEFIEESLDEKAAATRKVKN